LLYYFEKIPVPAEQLIATNPLVGVDDLAIVNNNSYNSMDDEGGNTDNKLVPDKPSLPYFTFGIVDSDSTLSYYKIHNGLAPPKP